VEGRARGRVRPVERPRRSQALSLLFTFFQPVTFAFLSTLQEQPMHAATRKHPYRPSNKILPEPTPSPSPRQLENIFVDVLVHSCVCQKYTRLFSGHSSVRNPIHLYHRARRRCQDLGRQTRHLHGKITNSYSPTLQAPLSREEYMNIVDLYQGPFGAKAISADSEPFRLPLSFGASWASHHTAQQSESILGPPREVVEDPQLELREPPEVREPTVSSKPSEPSANLSRRVPRHSETRALTRLLKVLKDHDCTHEAAFEAYTVLPVPGVSHLSDKVKRLLFRRLSVMEKKDKDSMLRYLSVVDDMKSADLPMTEAEWNSAIAFCGQCFAHVSAADMESALRMWRDMEQAAAVKSGNVTFNILFDMAAKAGKFVLAEMILKEMETRKLSINRYARVSYIYYNGLRADGDGVRKAYRELVDAGEIVNTVVLNCVMASLIRAGEPAAAEQVYGRMKRILANYTGESIPQLNWKQIRNVGRFLDKAARNFNHNPVKLQQLREEQVLAPDLHTFAIFVEYHASQTGEFLRIVALLTDMQHLGVPMHGRIFVKIFKGFAFHGGKRYSKWTKEHLESVWNAWLDAMDQGYDVRIMKWAVVWSVRAFDRCAGRDRTLEVWGELRRRWKPDDFGQVESAMGILRDILTADQVSYPVFK